MTKKLISLIIALILCFSFAISASAEPAVTDYIVDELGYLEAEDIKLLNEQAAAIYEDLGFGIFFVYTTEADLENYNVKQLVGGIENYYVMIENDTYWYSFFGGKAESCIDLATEETLRGVYNQSPTFIGGVSDFLEATAECWTYEADVPTSTPTTSAATEYFLYDEADLLSDAEEVVLEKKLAEVSSIHNAQIVVCTIPSMDGGDIDAYDDYVYDSMGFGYGEKHDGVMLLVCMDPREYRILSNGFPGTAIDSGVISDIGDAIVPDLSSGAYDAAFDEFVDQCNYYLDGYLNGYPFFAGKKLVIALIIGVIAGLIVALVLKGQLKTVRKQDKANVYVKDGSMYITEQRDLFLYRNVTRSRKSSNSSSSGGGSSRSSGGGSF